MSDVLLISTLKPVTIEFDNKIKLLNSNSYLIKQHSKVGECCYMVVKGNSMSPGYFPKRKTKYTSKNYESEKRLLIDTLAIINSEFIITKLVFYVDRMDLAQIKVEKSEAEQLIKKIEDDSIEIEVLYKISQDFSRFQE